MGEIAGLARCLAVLIYYHHRPEPLTPLDETMAALDHAVKSGKTFYAGLSNYSGAMTAEAVLTCWERGYSTPPANARATVGMSLRPEWITDGFTSRRRRVLRVASHARANRVS